MLACIFFSFFIFLPALAQANATVSVLYVDGVARHFRVFVPDAYDGRTAVPLVLAFHGRGGNGQIMERKTGFSDKAAEAGFIVVYPDALGAPPAWNAGFNAGRTNGDDIAFVRALLVHMRKNYRIDSGRIFATGHSSGAMMTYRLASAMPDQFAAIAPVAGTIGARQPDGSVIKIGLPRIPVSVCAIHGQRDRIVTYDGKPDGFLSVADSISFWVEANACAPKANTSLDFGEQVRVDQYDQCRNNSRIILYSLTHGNHDWPGGTQRLKKTPPQEGAFIATDVIWDFFATQTRLSP